MIFFEPHNRDKTLLPHNPWTAMISPRPIGWISTRSSAGEVNIAPYSYFNAVSAIPPVVMFSSDGWKDTLTFANETREFVWNMATWDLREEMNLTSANLKRGASEFDFAKLETAPCQIVAAPRVAKSPVAFECKVVDIIPVRDVKGRKLENTIVLGQVVGIHIDEQYIREGLLDTAAMKPLARLGYREYAVIEQVFAMDRPPGG